MAGAFETGMHALERNSFATAIQQFQSALSEDPDNALAHAMIAIALAQVGRRHAALIEARRAIALDPELPIAHVAAAYAHILHDDFRAAAREFRQALEHEPHNVAARLGLCRMARARRDPAELEKALAAFREIAPDDPEGDVLEAHLHLMRGRLGAAEWAARAALTADPEDPDAHTALGRVLARRGDADGARALALSALNLAPEDRDAHQLLADTVMMKRPVIGYWHRFSLWLSLGGDVRIVAVLIGIWIAYRVGVVLLDEAGLFAAEALLQVVWIGFVLATWAAGYQYRRMVERELERADLDPDY